MKLWINIKIGTKPNFSHPGMFNMTFPCTTTMGATDPARCLTHHPPYPHHPSIHWRQSLNYQYRLCSFPYISSTNPLKTVIELSIHRLCSFPSPPRFTKPCDIWDTDRPFCYTRMKKAGESFKTSLFCLFQNLTIFTLVRQRYARSSFDFRCL